MATVTLGEASKLSQDTLIQGVIETIITVNPIFEVMPFMEIQGNALAYNREVVAGNAQFLNVGGTITAKAPAEFDTVTAELTTLIGDAEVNGLIQATMSNFTDQTAIQIASKAKSIGRTYQDTMINGDGTVNSFEGMLSLLSGSQTISAGTNGNKLTFEMLDELIDAVKDKDGQVDYIMMHSRTKRAYFQMLRDLGGASVNEVIQLPSGRTIPVYRDVPIFTNDYIPVNMTQGAANNASAIFGGTFDDGSGKYGISGLTAVGAAGIRIQDLGPKEDADEIITRVKMYCGFANFSELGLAGVVGVIP